MSQIDLTGETVTSARTDEIKKEMKTKAFIKKAKREREAYELGQTRIGGQRIHKKTIEFHENKDSRRKNSSRKHIKVARQNRERMEQSTLF